MPQLRGVLKTHGAGVTRLRVSVVKLFLAVALLSLNAPCFGVTHFAAGVATGNIQNTAVTEASGIVASRLNHNVLWTHNDSLNPNQLFAMTTAGVDLGTYTVTGTFNLDWEDIAIGPGPTAGVQYLYI